MKKTEREMDIMSWNEAALTWNGEAGKKEAVQKKEQKVMRKEHRERERERMFVTHECTAVLSWKSSCLEYELISCPPFQHPPPAELPPLNRVSVCYLVHGRMN